MAELQNVPLRPPPLAPPMNVAVIPLPDGAPTNPAVAVGGDAAAASARPSDPSPPDNTIEWVCDVCQSADFSHYDAAVAHEKACAAARASNAPFPPLRREEEEEEGWAAESSPAASATPPPLLLREVTPESPGSAAAAEEKKEEEPRAAADPNAPIPALRRGVSFSAAAPRLAPIPALHRGDSFSAAAPPLALHRGESFSAAAPLLRREVMPEGAAAREGEASFSPAAKRQIPSLHSVLARSEAAMNGWRWEASARRAQCLQLTDRCLQLERFIVSKGMVPPPPPPPAAVPETNIAPRPSESTKKRKEPPSTPTPTVPESEGVQNKKREAVSLSSAAAAAPSEAEQRQNNTGGMQRTVNRFFHLLREQEIAATSARARSEQSREYANAATAHLKSVWAGGGTTNDVVSARPAAPAAWARDVRLWNEAGATAAAGLRPLNDLAAAAVAAPVSPAIPTPKAASEDVAPRGAGSTAGPPAAAEPTTNELKEATRRCHAPMDDDAKAAEGWPGPPPLASGVRDVDREAVAPTIAAGPRPFLAVQDEAMVVSSNDDDSRGAATATASPTRPSAATAEEGGSRGEGNAVVSPLPPAPSTAEGDRTSASPNGDAVAIAKGLSTLAWVAASRATAVPPRDDGPQTVETSPSMPSAAVAPAPRPSTAAADRTITPRRGFRAEKTDEQRNGAPVAVAPADGAPAPPSVPNSPDELPAPPSVANLLARAEKTDEQRNDAPAPPSVPNPLAGAELDDERTSEPRSNADPQSFLSSDDDPTAGPSNEARAKGSPSIPARAARNVNAARTRDEAPPTKNKSRAALAYLQPRPSPSIPARAARNGNAARTRDEAPPTKNKSRAALAYLQPRPEPATADASTSEPLIHDGEPYPVKNIESPHAHDVLCGRGVRTNNHIGNGHWLTLIAGNKRLYIRMPKHQKAIVALSIVRAVRSQSPPGRFLQKDPSSGLWYDVGDQKATDKTDQALREGVPHIRKKMENEKEIVRKVAMGQLQGGQQQDGAPPYIAGMPAGIPPWFPVPPMPMGVPFSTNGMLGPHAPGLQGIHARRQGGAPR